MFPLFLSGLATSPRLSVSPSPRLRLSPSLFLSAVLLFALTHVARAYNPLGSTWPTGTIPLRLQLDATATSFAFPLNDGATSWNSIAVSALNDWNAHLARTRFTATTVTTSATNNRIGDNLNQVFFATTIYDEPFDSRTLAVTLVDNGDPATRSGGLPSDTVRSLESDLIVNKNLAWNSYRGPINSSPLDLRRVVLHELGHVLGLDHPDQATPVQTVSAVMNSTVSNLETLSTDDIAGASYLYSTPFTRPVLTTQPTSQTAIIGGTAKFSIAVNGQDPPVADDFHSYHWYFKATGASDFEPLFTLIKPGSLHFGSVQLEDAGSYYFQAVTPDDTVTSPTVTLTPTPATLTPTTQLANLSTRGIGGSSTRTMTVGFVIKGPRSKSILLRAAGPTLATFGVAGTLADPQLVLKNSSGTTIATSSPTWDATPADAARITAASARVGAFALPAGSRDGVLLLDLAPGNYTMTTASPANATGTVLIEVYDADAIRDTASRIANLSTRGFVSSGTDTLIAGFVVQGPGPRTYLIRIAGDTLRALGVTGTLDDPFLKLYSGDTLLRERDDWDSPATSQPALRTAFTQVGAFTFTDRQEPAMLVTLQPGNYTAQASGLTNEGRTVPTGNALIEIYELP